MVRWTDHAQDDPRGGWVWQRWRVSYVTGASNWYWLPGSWARPAILLAGKGRGGCFYFFCFFTFIPVPLSSLTLSFISSTISSISFLPFSGRRHKMTHKGWRVVKPQHNQSIKMILMGWLGSKSSLQTNLTLIQSTLFIPTFDTLTKCIIMVTRNLTSSGDNQTLCKHIVFDSSRNICIGYLLEWPCWVNSNRYPKPSMKNENKTRPFLHVILLIASFGGSV